MRRIAKFLNTYFFFIPLVILGCSKPEKVDDQNRKQKNCKQVLSTIAQIGDLVSEIGGDRIVSRVLVRGELNPHTYELVKGDDEKIQGADCLFYNGLGLEHGPSVAAIIETHKNALAVGDAIQKAHPKKILWKDGIPDPHIWMDVSLWSEGVDPITSQLIGIDPEGESYYKERAEHLKERMLATDLAMFNLIQEIPSNKRYLVTSHDAFHYFARRYLAEVNEKNWSARFAAPEGLSPDGQLNAYDLQKIVDHLDEHRIEVLFPESNVSRDSIRKIADAGRKLQLDLRICEEVLYGDALRGKYLDAMMLNAETIARNLRGEGQEVGQEVGQGVDKE